MRIGLDFDGTIADAAGLKIRYARERWGIVLAPAQTMRPGAVPIIGVDRYETMIADVFGTPLSLELAPMPGAIETLARLAEAHELFVVTARLDHEVPFAHSWLVERAIPVRAIRHTSRGRKRDPCRELAVQVLLEDSPGELAVFAGDPLCAALLETPYNAAEARAAHVRPVRDWVAFERLCTELAGGGLRQAVWI